ncbi:MAG: CooT family nickel-binding protein [Deltaproteobacteria bacterium]|nr:CooT family nickel-binding protein [Deltaproteobacteria bacterium]
MCESNIYLVDPGQDDEQGELFLEAVDQLLPEEDGSWRVTSIFGEQKIVTGRIRSMHLVDHRIIFERGA